MITTAVSNAAKRDFMLGIHQPEDVYAMALYSEKAELGPDTESYLIENEVSGLGYDAGGKALKGFKVELDGDKALVSFNEPTWDGATITARGALLFNASKDGRAIATFDFGSDISSTSGDFHINFPDGFLIRIS